VTLRVGLAGRAKSGEDGADRAVGRRGRRSSAAVLLLLLAGGGGSRSIVLEWVVGGTVASVLSRLGKFDVPPEAMAATELPCVDGVVGRFRGRRRRQLMGCRGVGVAGRVVWNVMSSFRFPFLVLLQLGMTSWLGGRSSVHQAGNRTAAA